MSAQPQPAPTFPIAPQVEEKISLLEHRVPAAAEAALEIRITDERTEKLAVNARSILSNHDKEAEGLRDPLVRPHNAFVKDVNARFKKITDACARGVKHLDGQLSAWLREKRRLADEENRRREQEAERVRKEEEARVAAEAKAAGFTEADAQELGQLEAADAVPAPMPIPAPSNTMRTSFGSASAVDVWDFEVESLAQLAAAVPAALEVKRKPVLDVIRAERDAGRLPDEHGHLAALPGVRCFQKDSWRG